MLDLNTVMLGSDDPQALSAFYTKVLGEPGWQDSGYIYLLLTRLLPSLVTRRRL